MSHKNERFNDMNLGSGSVGRICYNYFLNRGVFSTETVESVVCAALRPELSCAGRAWFSGHDSRPRVCMYMWPSVMRLEGHCSRGVCCLLSDPQQQGAHGDPRGRLAAKKLCTCRLRLSLTESGGERVFVW